MEEIDETVRSYFSVESEPELDLHELMARASCVKRFCKIPDTFDVKTFIESVIKKEKSKDRNATANVVTIANALSG